MNLVDKIEQSFANPNVANFPAFKSGDTLAVHVRISEGNKTRVQIFEGICIARKQPGAYNGHFRVRKISAGGIGVERVFPYHCKSVEKVEVKIHGKTRRAKHYYLRDRSGKSARLSQDFTRSTKTTKSKK